MTDKITLQPIQPAQRTRPVLVAIPGSKSITNRALLLAMLATGDTQLIHPLLSDDTAHMEKALARLFGKQAFKERTAHTPINPAPSHGPKLKRPELNIQGVAGRLDAALKSADQPIRLFLGNAGTAMRSLAAVLSLSGANGLGFLLEGEARMHQRPIVDLVNALRVLGADITYMGQAGCPPLLIRGTSDLKGGEVLINCDQSSQYLSALLMAAPSINQTVYIKPKTPLISRPYVEITLKMMAQFGVTVDQDAGGYRIAAESHYSAPGRYAIEPDASSASYFLAAGAIGNRPVEVAIDNQTIQGAPHQSLQGDTRFAQVLEQMGAEVRLGSGTVRVQRPAAGSLQGIDIDMGDMPDAAMTLATTALFAKGKTKIRNIANWRIKETDRLAAMAQELRKVGAQVEEGEASLTITPPAELKEAEIETYNDHRMAMCFSLVAFGAPVHILNPDCVNKTFPGYFKLFSQVWA